VRLPDGKPLTLTGWGPGGNSIMLNTDQRDVAYFSSGVHAQFSCAESGIPQVWTSLPAAVRFTLEGDTLKPTVLWSGGEAAIPMVYHKDRLYLGTSVYDALSGRQLGGGRGKPSVAAPSRHHLLLAGNRFYGLDGNGSLANGQPAEGKPVATLHCYGLDGKKIADSPLILDPPTEEKKVQIRSQVGWDRWGFGYGMPFNIAGNCLYLRSNDELICIGGK
jgi:hypothetical protein